MYRAFGDGFVDRYSFTGYRELIPGSPMCLAPGSSALVPERTLYLFHPDVPYPHARRETEKGHRVWKFKKVELSRGPSRTRTPTRRKLSFTEQADFKYEMHANFLCFCPGTPGALIKVE